MRSALRNVLRARLRNSLTLVGVAIGTGLLVLLLGVVEGVEGIAKRDLLGALDLRSVTVFSVPGGGRADDQTVRMLRALPGVADVHRRLIVPAELRLQHFTVPLRLYATEIGEPETHLGTRVGTTENAATIPSALARLLGRAAEEAVGDELVVRVQSIVPGPAGQKLAPTDVELRLRIVGVRATENATGDSSDVYVALSTAQGATRAVQGDAAAVYSSLVAIAETPMRAVELGNELNANGYGTTVLKKQVDEVLATFGLIRLVLATIGGIAVTVAALGVANTMLMAVLERTREIGVLRSIGATGAFVRTLFLAEAGVLGLAGSVVGTLLALAAASALDPLLRRQFDAIGGRISDGPLFVITPELIAGGVFGGTLIAMIGAWLPSERASRLEPAAALRHE